MKTITEVLDRKKRELQRLQKEVEALQLAARLLSETEEEPAPEKPVEVARVAVPDGKNADKTSLQFP